MDIQQLREYAYKHQPNNQKQLVIHTLIEFFASEKELSMKYWMDRYMSHKFSTRLGEIEKDYGITLVERKPKAFTNRFGMSGYYMTYKVTAALEQLHDLYIKTKDKKK